MSSVETLAQVIERCISQNISLYFDYRTACKGTTFHITVGFPDSEARGFTVLNCPVGISDSKLASRLSGALEQNDYLHQKTRKRRKRRTLK